MVHGGTVGWCRALAGSIVIALCSVAQSESALMNRTVGLHVSGSLASIAYSEDVDDAELTKAEKRALKKRRKKERREAEKKRRENRKRQKQRAELIRQIIERRREMLADEVKSDIVWKNCRIGIVTADTILDDSYIERMLRTYLSSLAKTVAAVNSFGECVIDLTIDREGKAVDVALLNNTFDNEDLAEDLEQFFRVLNYGKNNGDNRAELQLMVIRELTQTNNK